MHRPLARWGCAFDQPISSHRSGGVHRRRRGSDGTAATGWRHTSMRMLARTGHSLRWVRSLQALRGNGRWWRPATLVAGTWRHPPASPNQASLMAYLGLVPSRAFQWQHAASGQGLPRQATVAGATSADRGGLELSVPGPDQPRPMRAKLLRPGEPGPNPKSRRTPLGRRKSGLLPTISPSFIRAGKLPTGGNRPRSAPRNMAGFRLGDRNNRAHIVSN